MIKKEYVGKLLTRSYFNFEISNNFEQQIKKKREEKRGKKKENQTNLVKDEKILKSVPNLLSMNLIILLTQ
jgi:hypothetical protein